MGAKINFSVRDYGNEMGRMGLYAGDITAVSIAGFLTQFGALRTSIDALILGVIAKEQWVGDNTVLSAALPASPFAQRENKWFVRYHGDTSLKDFDFEIPTADLALLTPNTEILSITAGVGLAFKTAVEAIGRSPDDDEELIIVDEVSFVARNT